MSASDLEKGSNETLDTPVNVGRRLGSGNRPVSVMLNADQYKAFERMYLTPGDAATVNPSRPALGNPTSLGVLSLLLTLMPLAINFLGWGHNAPGGNITLIPSLYWTSGLGLVLAGIGEFLLGNSFIMLVFISVGGFLLSLAHNLDPTQLIQLTATTVSPTLTGEAAQAAGLAQAQVYAAGMGIWVISWAILLGLYTFFASKIHIVFFFTFFNITMLLLTWGISFYMLAEGKLGTADKLITAAGAFAFCATVSGWWLLLSLISSSVNGPVIPCGDLSNGLPWKKTKKTV